MMEQLSNLLRSKGFEAQGSRCEHAAAIYSLASDFAARGQHDRALDLARRVAGPTLTYTAGPTGRPRVDTMGSREPPPPSKPPSRLESTPSLPTEGVSSAGADSSAGAGRKLSMWL